jgi:hypothetical protein
MNERLRQAVPEVRSHQRTSAVNSAVDLTSFAEITGGYSHADLPGLRDIGVANCLVSVGIANEHIHAHGSVRQNLAAAGHVTKCDADL